VCEGLGPGDGTGGTGEGMGTGEGDGIGSGTGIGEGTGAGEGPGAGSGGLPQALETPASQNARIKVPQSRVQGALPSMRMVGYPLMSALWAS